MAIRSGRFNFAKSGVTEQTIIKGKKSNAIFRVFNSGSIDFILQLTDSGSVIDVVTLSPTYCVDVGGGIEVQISAATADAQGIYEYVSSANEVRSGRFNTQNPRTGKTTADFLLVLDFEELGTNDKSYYRFFNSGYSEFGLYASNNRNPPAANATPYAALKPDQSLDIEIPGNKTVWVRNTTIDATPANTAPIEGIFDYLDDGI